MNIACNDALYYEFKKVWENIIVFINHIHGQNKEVCLVAKVKQVKKVVKLQIPAAKANPAPPVGPALGQAGVNIQQFCSQFNDKTASILKKAAGVSKGSDNAKKNKVATISRAKLLEIAQMKMPDLNAYTVEAAANIVEGTARNMGIVVEK